MSKLWGRLSKSLWPSQKSWTLLQSCIMQSNDILTCHRGTLLPCHYTSTMISTLVQRGLKLQKSQTFLTCDITRMGHSKQGSNNQFNFEIFWNPAINSVKRMWSNWFLMTLFLLSVLHIKNHQNGRSVITRFIIISPFSTIVPNSSF